MDRELLILGTKGDVYHPDLPAYQVAGGLGLVQQFFQTDTDSDNPQESPASYELCYRCHSRNSILNDESFKEHTEPPTL